MIYRYCYRLLITAALVGLIAAPCAPAQNQPSVDPQFELVPSASGFTVAHAKESFSTLSLEDSELKPQPVLEGGKDVTPDFERELIRVQWRPGDPIDLYVIRPKGAKNPPVVLYLYSFPSENDRFRDNRYCERLVKNGVAAVGFVSALTGPRIRGNRPMKQWFISELQESLVTTTHDVQLILNYLETRGDLDMTRVGMFGQGSGGTIAIMAAVADPRLKALDLLNPWGDWPDWLAKSPLVPKAEQANFLQPDFLKRVEPLDPVLLLPTLKSRAVRIQIVDAEADATTGSTGKILAAAPASAKIAHFPDGHAMYAVSSDGRLFEWLPSVLKPPTETKEAVAKTPSAITAR